MQTWIWTLWKHWRTKLHLLETLLKTEDKRHKKTQEKKRQIRQSLWKTTKTRHKTILQKTKDKKETKKKTTLAKDRKFNTEDQD